jgi:hypothetical protein
MAGTQLMSRVRLGNPLSLIGLIVKAYETGDNKKLHRVAGWK